MNDKFSAMEARAAERAKLKQEREEKRKREEQEKLARLLAEEEERKIREEEEKKRRIEMHRERKRLEKQVHFIQYFSSVKCQILHAKNYKFSYRYLSARRC